MSLPPWTWSPSSVSPNYDIRCITGDSTGQYIFAGAIDNNIAGAGAVCISTNNAASWSLSQFTDPVVSIACSSNGSILYAVASSGSVGGLYVSTDYGTSWTPIDVDGTGDTDFSAVCCDADGKHVLLASNKANGALGVINFSEDPTLPTPSWTSYGDPDQNWTSVAVNSDGSLYFALASDNSGTTPGNPGLFRSSDNAVTWEKVTFSGGIIDSQTWTSVAFSRDDSTAIICSSGVGVLGGSGSVYVNEDPSLDDDSWTKVTVENQTYVNVALSNDGNKVYACASSNGLYYGTSTSMIDDGDSKSLGTASCVYINPISGNPLVLGVTANGSSALYTTQPPPPICFKEGSKILCLVDGVEKYIPIETMRPGTLVKTALNGYKPVAAIGFSKVYNPGNGTKSVHHLVKCTPAKYPELNEDLVLTGAHAVLVDDITDKQRADLKELMGDIFVTDNKYRLMACVDDRAESYEAEGLFTIWHFALEHTQYTWNYGVYANGLLVETTSLRMIKEFSGMTLLH
jgi:hypothetical protein